MAAGNDKTPKIMSYIELFNDEILPAPIVALISVNILPFNDPTENLFCRTLIGNKS